MTEDIVRDLESLSADIPAFKSTELFKDYELENLKNKLNQFEFRLKKSPQLLQDFKDIIQFEKELICEIKHRNDCGNRKNVSYLENAILEKINFFYHKALILYPRDFNFSLDYLDYLNGTSVFQPRTVTYIKKVLEHFHNEPIVFQKIASWYTRCKKPRDAVKVLHHGLHIHPQDYHLYLDIIEIELSNVNSIQINTFKSFIERIIKNVPDMDMLVYIVSLLVVYERLYPVVEYILDNLMEKHRYEEKTWHTVATTELKGFYYKALPEELVKKSTKHSIRRCIDRYKEGIAMLPWKKKPALWCYYLDTLVDLQKVNPYVATGLKAECLKNALEESQVNKIKLEEVHWKAWVDVCGDDEEMVLNVLSNATRALPNSLSLWLHYLKLTLLKGDIKKSEEVFERAITSLGPRSVPIWDIYVTAKEMHSEHAVKSLFKRAICQPYLEVSGEFKVRYLNWACLRKFPIDVMSLYKTLADRLPYCKELHQEMIKLARIDGIVFSPKLNQIFHLYSDQFGHQDVDVWIEWMACLIEKGLTKEAETTIELIYKEALKKLPDNLVSEFQQRYDELRLHN